MFEDFLEVLQKHQAETMVKFMDCRDVYRFKHLLGLEITMLGAFLIEANNMVKELEELGND